MPATVQVIPTGAWYNAHADGPPLATVSQAATSSPSVAPHTHYHVGHIHQALERGEAGAEDGHQVLNLEPAMMDKVSSGWLSAMLTHWLPLICVIAVLALSARSYVTLLRPPDTGPPRPRHPPFWQPPSRGPPLPSLQPC